MSRRQTIFKIILTAAKGYRHLAKQCDVVFECGLRQKGWIIYINKQTYDEIFQKYTNRKTTTTNMYKYCIKSTCPGKRVVFKWVLCSGEELCELVVFHPKVPDMNSNYEVSALSLVRQAQINGFKNIQACGDVFLQEHTILELVTPQNGYFYNCFTGEYVVKDQYQPNVQCLEQLSNPSKGNSPDPMAIDTSYSHESDWQQMYLDLLVMFSDVQEENELLKSERKIWLLNQQQMQNSVLASEY
mmetsp:Transcript_12197/g.13485  ORF Transcript_12197/g.13485 Transcript_12197/m.13485 type:complete len:243 (+) Transcript_12197:229-957(+)